MTKVEKISISDTPDFIHIGFELKKEYMSKDIYSHFGGTTSSFVIFGRTSSCQEKHDIYTLKESMEPLLAKDQRILTHLPPEETSKDRSTATAIEDYLLEFSCTTDTCLIAVGDGVVRNLVGFVASTFMGGVPYVQVPMTLLALLTSSFTGNVTLDTPYGKDMIRTFWKPSRVYMDLCLLKHGKNNLLEGVSELAKVCIGKQLCYRNLAD